MAEGSDMDEVIKTEEGEDIFVEDQNAQPYALLLMVTQLNGKPLPIGGFRGRAMSQMLQAVAEVIPKEVVVMNDQEVVMELEEETSIMEVSRVIHGLFHWGGQSISVDSLVAKKDMIAEIVREHEVGQEKQRVLEQEHHRIREDQQEHQQQMMEVLEKVSDQVKTVENIHRGSVPVSEGEYYTPPVCQMRVNTPSTLSAPPNLP